MEAISSGELPTLPELGREDTYYGKVAHKAEKKGDLHTRAAYKVAQYLTLAQGAATWPDKLKYYRHAIEKHAHPKPPIDENVWAFYEQLKAWIRQEAGAEALRIARLEDHNFIDRTGKNEMRFRIVSDAAKVFRELLGAGGERPEWFNEHDYNLLRQFQLKWA
jgi:hypothetical protein